ncbi:MAG TPA: 1-deoxy-D-xylulose-5-phosphate reductoisomerase [Burkholderiales bacterium]|jgi:1-deoxy-D-xylulose-5-phosphate reductoisomerase|nr:1-deoxy-D-xylulose-5-phosphate reductoisomerase [Burkholderiales bacterium]
MAQNLILLGATGSIGQSTLDVVARHPDRYTVRALSAHRAADGLLALCLKHAPRYAVLSGMAEEGSVRRKFAEAGCRTELLFGAAALERLAADPEGDIVMAAIVGAAGLPSTIAAARAGKRVLLANKEALVMAGPLFMQAVRQSGATLLPIDSEHNAVFQCFTERRLVRKIVLTASGGPFRTAPLERLAQVTPEEACAHPNWAMGRKISVDSATMMNKGLEVIEACWLFEMPPERIEVVIHPQSIVHSLVEYLDGSMIAQLSNPDMRVPIAHALGFPERIESGARSLDLAQVGSLSFEPPDPERFPCLGLAYAALRAGGTAPAALNAANEVAVAAFLDGRLRYTAIPGVIAHALERSAAGPADSLEAVLEADRLARRLANERIAARGSERLGALGGRAA